MNDPDPAQAASLEDLAECLRQLHVRADRPSLRQLEARTKFANGLLPGTRLKRVRLGRTNVNDVLRGLKFPRKAFLLTFVEALNVDVEADRRWEQAWDRLAVQYVDQAAEAEAEQLRQQLAAAETRADRAAREASKLGEQLAEAKEQLQQQLAAADTRAERAVRADKEAEQLRQQLAAAETRADRAAREASKLGEQLAEAKEQLQQGMATGGASAVAGSSVRTRRVLDSGPGDNKTPLFQAILSEHAEGWTRQQSQVPTAPTADPETIADRLDSLSGTEAAQILKTLDPDLQDAVLDLLGTKKAGTIRRRM